MDLALNNLPRLICHKAQKTYLVILKRFSKISPVNNFCESIFESFAVEKIF